MCTQPRRVAAITLAEYVAKDRGQEIGLANDLDKMCCLLALGKIMENVERVSSWPRLTHFDSTLCTFRRKMMMQPPETQSESITSRSLEMRWAATLCPRFSVAPFAIPAQTVAGGISDPLHQQIL